MSDDITNSEQPATAEGRQYHVGVAPGEVARHILLVGDPKRARKVAGMFDEITGEYSHREYLTLTGRHRGLDVSVVGTGMSAANMEIGVIELCQVVEDPVMIRCGSCGGLSEKVGLGNLVISQGAARLEETSLQFVHQGFPAVAHPEIIMALAWAAEGQAPDRPVHVGITATASGFYGAQGREVPGFPPVRSDVVDGLARQGVLNLEMEISTLLTLASLRGFRAGAICAVYATRYDGKFIGDADRDAAETACVSTGLEALHRAAEIEKGRGDRAIWHPGVRS